MPSTDIDGSPLLILSRREAQALCDYFQDDNFYSHYHDLVSVWKKAEEVVKCEVT